MDLRDYLSVLRRRRWIVISAVLVVVAGAVALSLLQTPVYAAHARVLLQPSKTVFEAGSGQATSSPVRVDTEIQIFESAQVRDLVRKARGSAPAVSAVQVGQTDVIDVSAESTRPQEAADIANAYATSYIDFRRQQAVDALLAAGEQIQRKIDDLQKPIDDLTAAAAATAAANQKPNTPTAAPVPNPDRDALVSQQALFKERLSQLQVDAALKDGGAQLVGPAITPSSPVRPQPKHNALLALGAGLVLGLAAAFTLDHLDDSVKNEADIEGVAPGVSLLGVIPQVNWKNKGDARVISLAEPASPGAEAYRTLRTSVTFLALDRKLTVVQITSPNSSEGKSTTVANLAVAMSTAGQRVIVVDCDLRRPRLHHFFDLPNEVGFTSVLLGSVSLSAAVHEVGPRMRVLTAGPRPTNPSELLSSGRASEVLASARGQADFVLVDCPPVLPVTDAAALSAKVDGTLLVVNAGATSTKELVHALDLLKRVGAPMLGTVLNGVTSEGGYGYAYSYEYGPTSDSVNGRNGSSTNGNGSGSNGSGRRAKKGSKRQSGS
jgi:succinoglycan biosynthesis transport protein ExoP